MCTIRGHSFAYAYDTRYTGDASMKRMKNAVNREAIDLSHTQTHELAQRTKFQP